MWMSRVLVSSSFCLAAACCLLSPSVLHADQNQKVTNAQTEQQPDLEAADTTEESSVQADANIDGRELFLREWVPNDSRSHGGDGLGPLFNDSSCVACHNQGGTGGGGARGKNVDVLTAFSMPIHVRTQRPRRPARTPNRQNSSVSQKLLGSLFYKPSDKPEVSEPAEQDVLLDADQLAKADEEFKQKQLKMVEATKKRNQEQLASFHPGFTQSNSIVLHRGATYAGYDGWRENAANGQLQPAKTGKLGDGKK